MSSDVQNRKAIRQALAQLLQTALVGSGKPLDAVYRYRISKIEKNFVAIVTSAPAKRGKQAQPTRVTSDVDLDVHIFTIYSAENFSEEASEDKADDLEKAVSDVLMDNDTTDLWDQLTPDKSEYDVQTLLNGKTFRIETIPVAIQLKSD